MRDDPDFAAIASAIETDWHTVARPEQLPPAGAWAGWLIVAGRGFGKTRSGAEWTRSMVESREAGRLALVGPTAADARDVMVEGESGILAISPAWNRPTFEPSKRRLTWPNGAIATCYSAEEPERLRGPQHDAAWCDELAAWSNRDATWNQLQFGLRLGARPRVLVTTTPKPSALLKSLIARPDFVVTRGATRDNAANLAPTFLATVEGLYAGTRLGRQELDGELIEDVEDALWSRALIERTRIAPASRPALRRVVVAIDPAVSSGEGSDETGIIVAALGEDGHGYVLEDASGRYAPTEWALKAAGLYARWGADRVIAEVNQGGEMVEATLRMVDPNISYRGVHASRGKIARAEPVSALYEQGRIHHTGVFPALEDQITTYEPGGRKSPDRLDALVWAFTELMVGATAGSALIAYMRQAVAEIEERRDPAFGYAFNDAPKGGKVRLIAPPGVSTIMVISGAMISPDQHGLVTLQESDAAALRAQGWREAPLIEGEVLP